jgi:hypothetical protein
VNVNARIIRGVASLLATISLGRAASAQEPTPQRPAPPTAQTPRRQETIEIRGQVPTPQVVTVRPRETPAYSRKVLVPTFFDHDFWPSILPPLELVTPPASVRPDATGRAPVDSASKSRVAPNRPAPGTPPATLRP